MSSENITELETLKDKAVKMGITYHPSIGVDKLREKINEILMPTTKSNKGFETIAEKNARLRKVAKKQIRLRLTCMNPAKKNWPGEMISVSNSSIGWIKEFIPFEAEDGWHISAAIVDVLKDRKYTQFYTVQRGQQKVKKTRLVKEFAIEVLESLTIEELKELANKQAKEHTVE